MATNTNSSIELLNLFRQIQSRSNDTPMYNGGAVSQSRPVSDPNHQLAAATLSLDAAPRIIFGRIVDATPVGQVYKVYLDGVAAPVPAVFSMRTTASRFGAIDFTSLQPGTEVVCCKHKDYAYAVILCAFPPTNVNSHRGMFSLLHTSTRARADSADFAPYRMQESGGAISFSAGRPYDAIMGDCGFISSTGCRLLIDSFTAQLGVTEMSQLTFYHHDMLGKLAAYNFLEWTAARERESLNDQEEVSDWCGYAAYPWEQLGYFSRAASRDATRILTAQEWQKESPAYSKMELVDDYAMPFHRERNWHGYLGQGGRVSVCGLPEQTGNHMSYFGGSGLVAPHLPGLYDESVSLGGRRCVQSVKGISLAKRAGIAVPTRKRRPEDPNGDNPQNYKFSGQLGSGPAHHIKDDISTEGAKDTSQARAAGLMDMHAYMLGYAPNQPFISHQQDYTVPEERDMGWVDGKSEEIPEFAELRQRMSIDAERYKKTVAIDSAREQSVYTLPCGIDFLDDGGVVLYDGFGGEIRMTGGNITISAPGDVWVKSGRNTNIWGGDDINVRARNSVDVVASTHDVRLKAERNMQLLAGNSGSGGVLIESRSLGAKFNGEQTGEGAVTSGIVLRSPKSVVATWASNIYLRTGGEGDTINGGSVYIDAGRGMYPVVMVASNFSQHIKNVVDINFGEPGEATHTTYFSKNISTLSGTALIGGSIAATGGVYAEKSFFSSTGHIFTAKSSEYGGLVGSLEGESLTDTIEYLARIDEYIQTIFITAATTQFNALFTDSIYFDGGYGNAAVLQTIEVSMRTTEDYGVKDFYIFEDRWQQLARLKSESMPKWRERPVTVQKSESYPYPGREAFKSNTSLYRQDPVLFDAAQGRSKPHGSADNLSEAYITPTFDVAIGGSLGNYTVLGE